MNALEDRHVAEKQAWDQALKFMEEAVRKRLESTRKQLNELRGPGSTEQWLKWKSPNDAQKQCQAVEVELKQILGKNPVNYT